MTLEQFAQLAEIVAAVAVIASLLYVARELRQNTNAMLVNNADTYVDFNLRLNTPFATDREFAELWVKGASEFENLDAVDRQRLIVWEFQAFAAWSRYFHLRQQGLIADAQWQELVGTFEIFGRRQSVRESWLAFRDIYDESYRKFMAKFFESEATPSEEE